MTGAVWVNTTSALSASYQKNCPPRGSVRVRTPPCGLVRFRTPPHGSDRVRSTGYCQFSKKCQPRLGSVPRLVADTSQSSIYPHPHRCPICFLSHEKFPRERLPSEIYACGGDLLMISMNTPHSYVL